MFEALPVVVPTLREVAHGRLRPGMSTDGAATPETATAAVLLDAALDVAVPGALFDELELYLQAAGIESLRLPRRGRSAMEQMLDILAGVTLLRSRGCQRVILIVAAEGTIPSWEQSRAETLAGMLEFVRRHHGGSAAELLSAIAGLVTTIRTTADSVIGVATIMVQSPTPDRPPAAITLSRFPRTTRYRRARVMSEHDSSSPSSASPKALAISLRAGESTVSAVGQLYLWCSALASHTPGAWHRLEPASELRERTKASLRLHTASLEFHVSLQWLDEQWRALIGDMERRSPQSVVHALIAMAHHMRASAQQGRLDTTQTHARAARREAWRYLDTSTRLRWLDLCQQVDKRLQVVLPAIEHAD